MQATPDRGGTAHEARDLQAEVTLYWAGRTRVEVHRVRAGERLFAGGATGVLPVGQGLVHGDRFPFVSVDAAGAQVDVPRGVARVSGAGVSAGDDPSGGGLARLCEGEHVRLRFGRMDVEVRAGRASGGVSRPWRERIDLVFATRMAVLAMVAVTFQAAVAITDFGGDGIEHGWSSAPLVPVGFVTRHPAPPPVFTEPWKRALASAPPRRSREPTARAGDARDRGTKARRVADKGLLGLLGALGGPGAAVFSPAGSSALAASLAALGPGSAGGGDTAGLGGVGARTGPGGGPAGGVLGIGGFGGPGRGGPSCEGCALGDPGGLKKQSTTFRPERVRVEGGLSADDVGRVVRRHWNQVKACYEQRLQSDPNLAGKVAMRFVIGPAGTVGEAAASENGTGDDGLESCIAGKVRAWMFPAPRGGGVVEVNYPFVFQSVR